MNRLLVWLSLGLGAFAVLASWRGQFDEAAYLMASAAFARASAQEARK